MDAKKTTPDTLPEAPVCDTRHHHPGALQELQAGMPEEGALQALAELYRLFGDPTRVRILFVLFEAETCVCDVAEALGMTVSAISHQLRLLKAAKLVKYRREGKTVLYSLADDHVRAILQMGTEHVMEAK